MLEGEGEDMDLDMESPASEMGKGFPIDRTNQM